ncbi:MAG: hypothetical protein HYT87_17880 [Nitrospirae bacterium]|nr:hypothetical protein [Nitrospirota bacterium]
MFVSRPTPRRGRGSRAFTLMEVFFALVILAGSLFVFMRINNENLRRVREAREMHRAGLFLQMKLADLEAEGFPDEGARNGDFANEGYPDITWEITVSPANFGEITFKDLREAHVNVMWGGEHKQSTSVTTLLLNKKLL